MRIPSRLRFEIEMLEKRGYINCPLSWEMIAATFLGTGAGASIITLDSGDYRINFNLSSRLAAASLVINAGANVTFTSSETLTSLTLNGGTASFTAASNYTLIVDTVSIKSNGLLDLANSFLFVNTTPFDTLQTYLASAYNLGGSAKAGLLGDYTGPSGITSSAAVTSYAGGAVGAVSLAGYSGLQGNPDNPLGIAGLPIGPSSDSGNGTTIPYNQTVVRATRTGDLNGDGMVNDFDIAIFNFYGLYKGDGTGPRTKLGPQVGDFNNDGVVDDTDILIFNTAGNYDAPAAVAPGVTAVPIAATAGVSFTGPVATFTASARGDRHPARPLAFVGQRVAQFTQFQPFGHRLPLPGGHPRGLCIGAFPFDDLIVPAQPLHEPAGGLAEGFLQGRRVGGDGAGTANQERAQAVPQAGAAVDLVDGIGGRPAQGGGTVTQQGLQRRQRQANPGLAVRRGAEDLPDQQSQVGHGGVTGHDLQDEQMQCPHRPRLPLPPGMTRGLACVENGLLGHERAQIVLNPLKSLRGGRHPWPPLDG